MPRSRSAIRAPRRRSTRTTARRVVRALELAHSGASLRPDADRLWSEEMRVPAAVFALDWTPDELTRRIEQRTDAMLAGGALDEVRAMLRDGPEPSTTARTIHGLADCIAYVEGASSLEQCRARIVLADAALLAPPARLAS